MSEIFIKILDLSILGSFLALVVLIFRSLFYKNVKKSVFYLLWIIVFVKLICPLEFNVPMKLDFIEYNTTFGLHDTDHNAFINEEVLSIDSKAEDNEGLKKILENQQVKNSINQYDETVVKTIPTSGSYSLLKVITYIWISGFILLMGMFIFSYIKGYSKLNIRLIESDNEIYRLVQGSNIKLYRGCVNGPMVMGIFNSKIVLPYNLNQDNKFIQYALIHERQHLKFYDSTINTILLFIVLIHWFNPLVWLSYYYFKLDIEGFCDERVIAQIGEGNKTNYAEAIIQFAKNEHNLSPLYMLAFGEKNTKKRIKGILTYKPWKLPSVIASFIIVALVSLGFMIQSGSNSFGHDVIESIEGMKSQKAELRFVVLENTDYKFYGTSISDGLITITNGKDSEDRLFGFANTEGEVVIKPIYLSTLGGFSEGLAYVMTEDRQGNYVDSKGKVVIDKVDGKPFYIGDMFNDGYATVRTKEGSFVIDTRGQVILEPTEVNYQYTNLGNGYFQKATATITNDLIGVIDIYGNIIYEGKARFYGIGDVDTCFYTLDGEVFGLMDISSMKVIEKPFFYPLSKFSNNKAIVVTQDNTFYIINELGKKIVNLTERYSEIDPSKVCSMGGSKFALGFTNDKGAILIDDAGDIIIKTEYDYIGSFADENSQIAFCKKNNKYGYINLEGNELLEPAYDRITNGDEGKGFVFMDRKPYVFSYSQSDIATSPYNIIDDAIVNEVILKKDFTGLFDEVIHLTGFSSSTIDYFRNGMVGTTVNITKDLFEINSAKVGSSVTINNPKYRYVNIEMIEEKTLAWSINVDNREFKAFIQVLNDSGEATGSYFALFSDSLWLVNLSWD